MSVLQCQYHFIHISDFLPDMSMSYVVTNTVELHLSECWLSGLPIIQISLVFWVNIFLL